MENSDNVIRQKAAFVQTLKETSGDVKFALEKARFNKVEALTHAANDSAFRKAWEIASNQRVF